MCFYKFLQLEHVTREDERRCFKIVYCLEDENIPQDEIKEYRSGMDFTYAVGETYTEDSIPLCELDRKRTLEEGVFHSYGQISYKDIEQMAIYNNMIYPQKFKILECVIPPDTPFWFNPEMHELASTSIKVVKAIDPRDLINPK